jgi:hypothetical protein
MNRWLIACITVRITMIIQDTLGAIWGICSQAYKRIVAPEISFGWPLFITKNLTKNYFVRNKLSANCSLKFLTGSPFML